MNSRFYTFFFIVFLLLALFAIFGLFSYLRKRTNETSDKKDWYRYVGPFCLAVFLAGWGGHGIGIHLAGIGHWLYLAVICIGLPLALAYFLNKSAYEKKTDRILMLVAWLLFVNVAIVTTRWNWHVRNRVMNMDGQAEGEAHHLTERNWFVIPLWIVTILFGGYSTTVWRKNNQNGDSDDYLPM